MEFTAILGFATLISKLAMDFMDEVQRSDVYTPEQKAAVRATMEAAFAGAAWRVHGDLVEVQAALKVINEALAPKP